MLRSSQLTERLEDSHVRRILGVLSVDVKGVLISLSLLLSRPRFPSKKLSKYSVTLDVPSTARILFFPGSLKTVAVTFSGTPVTMVLVLINAAF